MTPLGASLAFILVSILISIVKHFIFPSSATITNEQSQIQLKKLYTITDKRPQKQNKSYASFYQAYHQFHMQQIEEKRFSIEENFMQHYNSLVMKKTIINDELAVTCEEDFLVVVSEGIRCENQNDSQNSSKSQKQCGWKTIFQIYQLPFLKEQTKETIALDGRIGLTKKDQKEKVDLLKKSLQCKKTKKFGQFFITFPLSVKNIESEYLNQKWTLNKLYITKNIEEFDKLLQVTKKSRKRKNQKSEQRQQKLGSQHSKKSQSRRQQIQKQSKKTVPKPFFFQLIIFELKSPRHYPQIYNANQNSLCYTTQQQPWLIRYTKDNEWQQINILNHNLQEKVYQILIYSTRIPPFQRNQIINVKFLFSYTSEEYVYNPNCDQNKQCMEKKSRDYITVVYLHTNSQYRVEKFYIQLTFDVSEIVLLKSSKDLQNPRNLASYAILISEMNPSRSIYSDCAIDSKRQQIFQRHFDKFYWIYENKLIYSIETYSLMCVFTFDVDQHLRVIQIPNIVHSIQVNKHSQLAFLDWKSVKKIVNYKESYQQQIERRNIRKILMDLDKYDGNLTSNNSELKRNLSDTKTRGKRKKAQTTEQIVQGFLSIMSQQLDLDKNDKKLQHYQTIEKQKQKEKSKEQKKKSKKKSQNEKKHKKMKKKKNKQTQIKLLRDRMTMIQGTHKPTIQTSRNYEDFRVTQFPHRSMVHKYRFPLPFLLSFTRSIQIVNSDPSKPLILFSGIKQYLFSYKPRIQPLNQTSSSQIMDYRYLTLGSAQHQQSKSLAQTQGSAQHQIQTISQVLKAVNSKQSRQTPTIDIKDQTHPQTDNAMNAIFQSDESILNQIKAINTVPIFVNQKFNQSIPLESQIQLYQKYLVVVWGWGIEVYQIDWDKDGFKRVNVTQEEIQLQLSKRSGSLVQYFLPFIQLFATFYCMFQALISSR